MDLHRREPIRFLELLATLLDSGVAIDGVPELAVLTRPMPGATTIPERLLRLGVVDATDERLLSFADQSGRLPEFLFRQVERMRARRARRFRLAVRLAYPFFLACLGPMLLALPLLVLQGFAAWARAALPIPGLLVLFALLVGFGWPRLSIELRRRVQRGWIRVPLVGVAFAHQQRAEGLRLLGMGVQTGRSASEIVAVVAQRVGRPVPRLAGSEGWTEVAVALGLVTGMDIGRTRGAEQAGRLDEVALRLADEAEEASNRAFGWLGVAVAGLVGLVVFGQLAMAIIDAGTRTIGSLEDQLDGLGDL